MFNWKKKNKKNQQEDLPRGRPDGSATQNPLAHRFANSDEPPTVQMDEEEVVSAPPPPGMPPTPHAHPADPETVLFTDDSEEPVTDVMKNPVTGWLVVVEGPGKGTSYQIGLGVNSVGRAVSQRISIDHGDAGISRENHCMITFDPKSSLFYLQHGEGQNLTYLADQPVLSPTLLPAHSRIQLSETYLIFTPFCGEHFNWKANSP